SLICIYPQLEYYYIHPALSSPTHFRSESTWPSNTSSTASAATPVSASSCFTTATPRSTALTEDKLPKKAPIGVRRAATITASCIIILQLCNKTPALGRVLMVNTWV